jgi:cysteine desulfurase
VLLAMGIDPILGRSSVRMTLGHSSTPADVEALLSALPAALDRARRAGQVRIDARLAASVRAEG